MPQRQAARGSWPHTRSNSSRVLPSVLAQAVAQFPQLFLASGRSAKGMEAQVNGQESGIDAGGKTAAAGDNSGMSDGNSTTEAKSEAKSSGIPADPGLGDLAKLFFESVGVTKDRYRAAKEALGLDPTCRCDDRRKWLNAMGHRLGVDGVVLKMARWMDRGKR